jgi:signal transduction histidine kinase
MAALIRAHNWSATPLGPIEDWSETLLATVNLDAFFTTRATVGTGIGLFVAKQFVEGHGGQIRIESRNVSESHGTAVRIFLPLHTAYA